DVFTKLWVNRAKMTGFDYFQAYFYKMAQNHAITLMRRMAHETLILAELKKEISGEAPSIDEGIFQKELNKKIQDILGKLPLQQRLVYKMTREQGLRQEQIALQLKISPSTVKNHMTCALRTLRNDLLQYFRTRDFYLLIVFLLSRH
ncbi:MAG: sigma-70 family RNA polymerase sigma factor, partial [Bacteroidota bacterium]